MIRVLRRAFNICILVIASGTILDKYTKCSKHVYTTPRNHFDIEYILKVWVIYVSKLF